MTFEPPQRLVRALGETYGDAAAADWLGRISAATQGALDVRELTAERVQAPGGRSSLVVLVQQPGGGSAVLKVAPEFAGPHLERAALAHWNGWGAVRLLDDPAAVTVQDTALLIERLHPEVSLHSLPEAKALLEASGTVRKLWVEPPPAHPFETVTERTARQSDAMRATAEPLVVPLVDAALAARDELVSAPPEPVLLHGNFRQSKVLAGERTPWLAVGPDPVVGERAYDLARLVRDRVDDLVAAAVGPSTVRRRVNRLADSLEVDRGRLHGWTLFRAVESGARAIAAGRRQDGELLLEFAGWL
ncbi:aminoglycoside phosphotransferase family protein [Streptomyces sp. NBC_00344]|uniref:aminoglycoside phosphotransferase family protein n=1 Tax=Streptomyces sp. NBC_00344 TaxID=2975720 RepID=UPI002E1E7E81